MAPGSPSLIPLQEWAVLMYKIYHGPPGVDVHEDLGQILDVSDDMYVESLTAKGICELLSNMSTEKLIPETLKSSQQILLNLGSIVRKILITQGCLECFGSMVDQCIVYLYALHKGRDWRTLLAMAHDTLEHAKKTIQDLVHCYCFNEDDLFLDTILKELLMFAQTFISSKTGFSLPVIVQSFRAAHIEVGLRDWLQGRVSVRSGLYEAREGRCLFQLFCKVEQLLIIKKGLSDSYFYDYYKNLNDCLTAALCNYSNQDIYTTTQLTTENIERNYFDNQNTENNFIVYTVSHFQKNVSEASESQSTCSGQSSTRGITKSGNKRKPQRKILEKKNITGKKMVSRSGKNSNTKGEKRAYDVTAKGRNLKGLKKEPKLALKAATLESKRKKKSCSKHEKSTYFEGFLTPTILKEQSEVKPGKTKEVGNVIIKPEPLLGGYQEAAMKQRVASVTEKAMRQQKEDHISLSPNSDTLTPSNKVQNSFYQSTASVPSNKMLSVAELFSATDAGLSEHHNTKHFRPKSLFKENQKTKHMLVVNSNGNSEYFQNDSQTHLPNQVNGDFQQKNGESSISQTRMDQREHDFFQKLVVANVIFSEEVKCLVTELCQLVDEHWNSYGFVIKDAIFDHVMQAPSL